MNTSAKIATPSNRNKGRLIAPVILSAAEKLIKKNLSENDNEKLINETLKSLKGYEA